MAETRTRGLRYPICLTLVLALVGAAYLLFRGSPAGGDSGSLGEPVEATSEGGAKAKQTPGAASVEGSEVASSEDEAEPVNEEEEEVLSEDERREREEEALVEKFDELTDKWREPSEKGVTMDDVLAFSQQFAKVPKARRDECLHRALNLIPDDNVMLLAGILMDKTQDKELVELVYNDILNRDEDVKKPILQQIIKDKSHPCWADTAWILDVTGELPEGKK